MASLPTEVIVKFDSGDRRRLEALARQLDILIALLSEQMGKEAPAKQEGGPWIGEHGATVATPKRLIGFGSPDGITEVSVYEEPS